MGAKIEKTGTDVEKLFKNKKINTKILFGNLGVLVVSQTRHRIESEKYSLIGKTWKAWAEKYAKTRHGRQSLLIAEGDLLQSISFNVSGNSVEVGSPLAYSGPHQLGNPKKGIPQREYLGLSKANEKEIEEELLDFLEGFI